VSLSDYLELELLDHVLGGADYSRPATVYVALYSAAPTDSGGGTELTSGTAPGYARIAVTNNATNFPAATTNGTTGKGEKKLAVAHSSAANSGGSDWPTIVAWALCDASTGGNTMCHGAVSPLAVTPAAQFTIPADTIISRLD
jgi:hypothetical protein